MSEPTAEELDHPRVGVGEQDLAFALASFAGVQSYAGSEEGGLVELADPPYPVLVTCRDLCEPREVLRVSASLRTGAPGRRCERDVADPDGHGRLGDAEEPGDVGEGTVLGAEHAGSCLSLELSAVPHGWSVPNVRSIV